MLKVDYVNSIIISAMDHVRELRFSNIVHLTSKNNSLYLSLRTSLGVKNRHIHVYVLIGVINTIYKHCHT